jgi:Ca-activated chloride channel family protein
MSDTEDTWKLHELADLVGVSPRTIRYYVQRGLLPPPPFRGKDTVYTEEHRVRLRAIRRLQDRFLPLDAIQAELEGKELDALRALADGPDADLNLMVAPVPEPPRLDPVIPASTRWERWVLAPGLELHVSDSADADTRALAESLRKHAERRNGNGGAKP